ncbi:hypothetical protein OS187_11075 [Xanthomonadaceae bacterium JHOS43]|nr:hypothetical protein [Xanthomonadaceae bacterium JHOS43]MCX7562678.1 hypothetical protein [Xanthomonadaceae bacterium XH05]
MKIKIVMAAVFVGTLFLAGCGDSGKDADNKSAQVAAEPAALPVPSSSDNQAWRQYLVNVAKRNLDGIRSSPYMYYLPAVEADDFEEQYTRQLDNVAGSVARGVLPGNMLAFGSPASSRMADLIVEAFTHVQAGSMKDVRVLFIGNAEDIERVKGAVEPSGATVVFHEVK